MVKYSYDEIYNSLKSLGYTLIINKDDFKGVTLTPLICTDDSGYKYKITYDAVMRGKYPYPISKNNPFTIQNLNQYIQINQLPFECISTEYHGRDDNISFKCKRCGTIVHNSWNNISKDGETRRHIVCPNCDRRYESIHAIVLKQVFMHEYPDTVEEDKSCINPNTGRVIPTDIVNHRLKIAIEVESQWHDYDDIKIKDKIKKEFWISKGYSFYALDIRDYTILEMCNVFFHLDKIPDYINYDYKSMLNIRKIQDMLDSGKSPTEICSELGIDKHRFYDAVHYKKLQYPEGYIRSDYTPVVQFDLNGNKINEFNTIQEAAEYNNINAKSLSSALRNKCKKHKGYIWKYKRDCV